MEAAQGVDEACQEQEDVECDLCGHHGHCFVALAQEEDDGERQEDDAQDVEAFGEDEAFVGVDNGGEDSERKGQGEVDDEHCQHDAGLEYVVGRHSAVKEGGGFYDQQRAAGYDYE